MVHLIKFVIQIKNNHINKHYNSFNLKLNCNNYNKIQMNYKFYLIQRIILILHHLEIQVDIQMEIVVHYFYN
jgi:hypothetical protein